MNHVSILLVCAELALLAACGQVEEARNQYKAARSGVRAARNLATSEEAQQKRAVRARSGGTLSMPCKKLGHYLPTSIAGFEAVGEPKGEPVSRSGVSYSACERRCTEGAQHLKGQLMDYNGANTLYAGATVMLSAGFSQKKDGQLMRGCSLGVANVRGWETLQKKEPRASVALGVGDRFFVTVESDEQDDTDFMKQVARDIDLNALAKY